MAAQTQYAIDSSRVSDRFLFQTMAQARDLAIRLAQLFPHPASAHHGLSEMLVNAIEHGNLEIGFEEKTNLLRSGQWRQEIEKRLSSPRWASRFGEVALEETKDFVAVTIRDAGSGFDWKPYMELSAERVRLPNGRGIATARLFAFTSLTYHDEGREVRCTQAKD